VSKQKPRKNQFESPRVRAESMGKRIFQLLRRVRQFLPPCYYFSNTVIKHPRPKMSFVDATRNPGGYILGVLSAQRCRSCATARTHLSAREVKERLEKQRVQRSRKVPQRWCAEHGQRLLYLNCYRVPSDMHSPAHRRQRVGQSWPPVEETCGRIGPADAINLRIELIVTTFNLWLVYSRD
jgi:hypothetical protein